MAFDVLYADESEQKVKRHSSIDQFSGFLSVMKKGGWTPIIFDQLDGITCDEIKTHPVAISFSNDVGYVFPEAHCTYASDKFVYFDKEGVEQRVLPACFGEGGQFYDIFVKGFSFINFDDDTSVGTHNIYKSRTGLDYVVADETLPAVE